MTLFILALDVISFIHSRTFNFSGFLAFSSQFRLQFLGLLTHIQSAPKLGFASFHLRQVFKSQVLSTASILDMTQCQDEFRNLSGRTQKLKVAKWCWKQQNEHNLMYISHKQCENMQKIQ